ncbi:MAG: type II secretion system protein [Oscillospiraceae bacterium]
MGAKIKSKLQNQKGMTMVSVLVAFAILLFILAMFSQAVTLSLNLYAKSEDIRKASDALYSAFYRETPQRGEIEVTPEQFYFLDKEHQGFSLPDTGVGEYRHEGKSVWFFAPEKVEP